MRLLAVVMLLVASSLPAQALTVSQVAGSTRYYLNSSGQHYWTKYYRNGTTFSGSPSKSGNGIVNDSGHWRIRGGALCERYDNWAGGQEFCR